MNSCVRLWEAVVNLSDIPNLTFPSAKYGPKQVPIDLRVFLYKGSLKVHIKDFELNLKMGFFGAPETERLSLITRIHDELNADLVAGGSQRSLRSSYYALRNFFLWAEDNDFSLSLGEIEEAYLRWSEQLIERNRSQKEITQSTLHSLASVVGNLLTRALGATYPLLKKTRIRKKADDGKFSKSSGGKSLLKDTMELGACLFSICEQLQTSTIKGELPVRIKLAGIEHEFWCRRTKPRTTPRRTKKHNHELKISQEKRLKLDTDHSIERRAQLLNLALEAQLLIFIAQTGMNLEQAFKLQVEDFRYISYLDGYRVSAYKSRREGSVLFEVFSEYRPHFEKYLQWRKEWFDADTRLFPFVKEGGSVDVAPSFHRVMRVLSKSGVKYVGPQSLRKARINWLLREIGDAQKVSELAQHDLVTLHKYYEIPNAQVAMVEIAKFHQKTDPFLLPPAPGRCVEQVPSAQPLIPKGAPVPDCSTGGGCLFCENHRDVDSSDHVWSLSSYKHLKTIELATYRPPETGKGSQPVEHPAKIIINRLTEKLKHYESSSDVRRAWVEEACMRVNEGEHHPMWGGFIQMQELNMEEE